MTSQEDASLLYLSKSYVEQACAEIDSVAVMRDVFALHGTGQTILPDESYLSWTNGEGEQVRNLNMPAYIGGDHPYAGTKIINGNIHNPRRGLARASGITILYDTITTYPLCIMEASYLSSLRTASVSALAIDLVKGYEITTAAIIGAGALALAHIRVLATRLPTLETIYLYDIDPNRLVALQTKLGLLAEVAHIRFCIMNTGEEAIRVSQVVIPVTTTTTGYIQASWLQSGSILINVSLDDALPEVVFQAEKVIVDDWQLVKNDSRRLLGRMFRAGQLCGPDEEVKVTPQLCRRVDAQLGELVLGIKPGRNTRNGHIFVNPFGLAIEDVALAAQVYQVARSLGLGEWLPR